MRRASALGCRLILGASVVVACSGESSDVRQAGVAQGAAKPAQCNKTGVGEAGDHALASCLTKDDSGTYEAAQSRAADVAVFVDRSASMQGFLDPAYPTHVSTDYRSVIDKVLVG